MHVVRGDGDVRESRRAEQRLAGLVVLLSVVGRFIRHLVSE